MENTIFENAWLLIEEKSAEIVKRNPETAIFNKYAKSALINSYESTINYYKNTMQNNNTIDPPTPDRHKTAAAMIIAIMRANVIVVDHDTRLINPQVKHLYNEELAISIGLSMLNSYMRYETEIRIRNLTQAIGDDDKISQLEYLHFLESSLSNTIFLPKESASRDDYMDCLKKQLYYDNKLNHLSLLAISHLLFYIEVYHKHHVGTKFFAKEYMLKNEKRANEDDIDSFVHKLCDYHIHPQ